MNMISRACGYALLLGSLACWVQAAEPPWFSVLSNADAWSHLPKTVDGARSAALPVWARIMARPLPQATAAMLEMDRVQRDENPLEPQLRAKIRWVAARTNGCRFSQACAEADLARAGGKVGELPALLGAAERLDAKHRRVFAFARQLCEGAYEVTDEDVRQLLADHGAEGLTAIVLTLAYANFQDRLLLALGVDSEMGDPLPPLAVRFDWNSVKEHPPVVPARVVPEPPADAAGVATRVDDETWRTAPLAELRNSLEKQQLRAPRIAIPPDDVVERQTPPGLYPPGRAAPIKWNSVTFGYQPKLAYAWMFTMRRFREESALPDGFRQSVFWVVTRSNQCFY